MDTRTLSRRVIRSRWLGLAVAAAVLVAWLIFLRGQIVALQRYPWQLAPLPMALGVGWGTLYFAGLAYCWALLLHQNTASSGQLAAAARIWLLSMITRYIPGNVWHILSRVALADQIGVAAGRVLSSATIEQVLTLLGALALFGLTLPFWGIAAGAQAWLLLLLPLGLALLHPRVMGAALIWAAAKFKRPELAWHYSYRQVLVLLLAYVAANLCAGLALWTLLLGLTPVRSDQVALVIGASALAWAVGYLSFLTPSGLGVREALLTTLLAQVYPLPVAIVGSLLFRLVLTIGEFLAVLVAWIYGNMRKEAADGITQRE